MAIYNIGSQGSQIVGGHLYDTLGYGPLILIAAGTTAVAWVFVPFLRIDHIEAQARGQADELTASAHR
jgi:predicted MFS family arabinose efflux permease